MDQKPGTQLPWLTSPSSSPAASHYSVSFQRLSKIYLFGSLSFSSDSILRPKRSGLVKSFGNPSLAVIEMDQKPGTQIQGSIAYELYSDILQSSSVELDGGSTAAQADDNLHESDPGDLWYDDESSYEESVEKLNKASDMEREWQRRHNQFHTIGYRDGLIAAKEAAAQEGFNIGFKDSVFTGYNWGVVRGITSAMACLPAALKDTLVETEETRNKFQCLHESVRSLSTTDALKLFYEDQKKSSNQKESAKPSSSVAASNHQSSDISILENYRIELQSLISESPLLEGHLKIN
ncbi:hypothetical protein DH2020_025865 [Rehmannia glutinosa]|uniref:Essential protein Yae1 N-terminal domain-containing protein n=1 Tax=Rehmannia glutinosa TaxID=99300 RepID=A0ABR0W2H2_REHGL